MRVPFVFAGMVAMGLLSACAASDPASMTPQQRCLYHCDRSYDRCAGRPTALDEARFNPLATVGVAAQCRDSYSQCRQRCRTYPDSTPEDEVTE